MKRAWLQLDLRTLGLLRIALALLLLIDVAKRAWYFDLWYSQTGFLPTDLVLRYPIRPHWSFFNYCMTDMATWLAFGAVAVCYLGLLLGFKTKIFQVASYLSVVSLHVRADILSNGGDFVICILALWTIFLPLGARFSVDSLYAKGRQGPLHARLREELREDSATTSLGAFALLLQLAVIYFFNAVHKSGETWINGTSTYWVAHQERIVTMFGAWLREWAPLWVWQVQTYATLVMEYALPLLILSPWGIPWTRRVAILFIWALHIGIAAIVNVGLFSPVMMVFALCLVSAEDWRWLERKLGVPEGPRRVPALVEHEGFVRRSGSLLAQLCVLFLLVVGTSQALVENPGAKKVIQIKQPRWMARTISYSRLQQGWKMFASNAPRDDMWLVVDAITESGKHIDPYNQVGSAYSDPLLRNIPGPLEQNSFWCDYTVRIPGMRAYERRFAQWIFRHHERTGRPDEKITSFRAYKVMHNSPAPGEDEPTNVRAHLFLFRGPPPGAR